MTLLHLSNGLEPITKEPITNEPLAKLDSRRIALLPNEYWWGGAVNDGLKMPFGHRFHHRDLQRDHHGNQATPLLLSSLGRYVWSEQPFTFTFEDDYYLSVRT